MWDAEQCRGWTVVGGELGLALLLMAGAAVPAALLLARRIRPGQSWIHAIIVTALVVPLVFLLLWRVAPNTFFGLTCKEGWVELVTLPLLLMAATVFLYSARSGQISRWGYAWAALCLLVVLEEIDWGQLILGFTTPHWALSLSGRSDRLNFHNTGAATVAFGALILVVFVLLPVAARLRSVAPRLGRWGLRPPSLPIAVAVLVVVLGINPLSMALGVDAHLQEVTEWSLALLLLALALDWSWEAAAVPGGAP